ncbi:MAG: DPP IV N-terminal domain-containing protein, partial [Candidatus Acidiferrales bacterium]
MDSYRRRVIVSAATLCFVLIPALANAQGTLEDYQRAQRFLGGNMRSMVSVADIRPTWIEGSDRFWYRSDGPKGSEFIVVDAAKNTSAPAFDHARLAEALSRASRQPYEATRLPFFSFEYTDKETAIRFQIDDAEWTCKLTNYECTKSSHPTEDPYENVSPDGRWAAYLKDHNLFLRDTSTGAGVQLTRDGVPGWDYATPLPDLRTLVTEGIERGEDAKE